MPFIEAPTTFYMGRRWNPQQRRITDEVVYYDSRDLTTHAVVVGMTGSGKTGLCISLLEEAALDNIPAIVIDPKGDITNLVLNFPQMQPNDFLEWVNVDDARRANLSVEAYAADIASQWRDGLASWGIAPERVEWLKRAAQVDIYTPGSEAGLPISILASLRAPRGGFEANEESNREKISGTVTALLALIGRSARPTEDRDHVLLSNIFEVNWRAGRDLTLEDVILQVQQPPFERLGVLPVDRYISEKDRYKLATDLNSIMAAPSFQSWLRGEPLDIQRLLYQPNGRPKVSIFYIAHLSESERQFIITLILENMLSWMRTLSGTTSLRALLYIDEMFGYFPPHPRNPPTKDPILRLLKQARAFGVGLVLATQNPGDLDYKGLSNAGTWFIGRLQSDNDRARVMDGLRQLASANADWNLRDVEQLVAQVEPRVFLMHNVHNDGGPLLMHTRWAMSYLRGPLTREQVQRLMAARRAQVLQGTGGFAPTPSASYGAPSQAHYGAVPAMPPQPAAAPSWGPVGAPPPPPSLPAMPPPPPTLPGQQMVPAQNAAPNAFTQPHQALTPHTQPQATGGLGNTRRAENGLFHQPPPVPSGIAQYYVPEVIAAAQAVREWEQRTGFAAQGAAANLRRVYRPALLAQVSVRFQDRKTRLYTARSYSYRLPDLPRTGIVMWDEYSAPPVDPRRITGQPQGDALFAEIAESLTDERRIKGLQRELVDMLYSTARLVVPYNAPLNIFGNPDEDYSAFLAAVQQAAREARDGELDAMTRKYEVLLDRIDEKIVRKARELEAEQKELKDRRREELFTAGEAALSLLRGRTTYTLSRATRSTRMRRQTSADLKESYEVIDALEAERDSAAAEFEQALQALNQKWAQASAQVEEYAITPYKKDIQVELFGIGWLPAWTMTVNGQAVVLPAI